MTKINFKINNIPVQAEPGSTILEAARAAGIQIPTLCYLKDVNKTGACRVCTVEIKGAKSLGAACVYPVSEGWRSSPIPNALWKRVSIPSS